MVVTSSMFWEILFLPPVILTWTAIWLRRSWQFERYYDLVVVALALGLGTWAGLLGISCYGIFWYFGFLFNSLIIGLICTRQPILYGLLASLYVTIGAGCFFFWGWTHSGLSLDEILRHYIFSLSGLICLPFIGMALSLIPTVPIALYRSRRLEAKLKEQRREEE